MFQSIYNTPYFLKNLCLLAIQFTALLFIYLLYFRSDGGNLKNAMKILSGLNSNTFNYLETNKDKLNVYASMPVFSDSYHADIFPDVKK